MMLLLTSCSLIGMSNLENPNYTILSEHKSSIELRKYEETKLVTATEEGEFTESSNANFRKLFKYISGENKQNQKISMTAPVFMTMPDPAKKNAKKKMSFVVPAKFAVDTPQPNEGVSIDSFPERKVAVISFSGRWSEESFKEKEQELRNWLLEKGYETKGEAYGAAYDPPWAIPFLRRNEVHIEVLDSTVS